MLYGIVINFTAFYSILLTIMFFLNNLFFFIFFIRPSPDIRWKCYKNTTNSRSKKDNIEIYENRMLSVIKVRKVDIEPTK